MPDQMDAARNAWRDQAHADATDQVDLLTAVLRTRTAEVGEPRALANVKDLISGAGEGELRGLFTVALCQLARRRSP